MPHCTTQVESELNEAVQQTSNQLTNSMMVVSHTLRGGVTSGLSGISHPWRSSPAERSMQVSASVVSPPTASMSDV